MKLKLCFLFIFSCVLVFCVINIFYDIYNETKQKEIIDSLIEIGDVKPSAEIDKIPQIDFSKLKEVNDDIVGWIIMDGTQVNYPIVQGDNNSYYLNHSYDKSYNSYGSIFMDYSSNNDFSDLNTFLYGHYTGNGSMFGELKKYMNESFYLEHPFFYILTPQQNYKVEVFSVYTDEALSDSYNSNFGSLYDFKIYLEIIKNKRRYKTNTNVNYALDRIITLYSCSHESGSKTERYFIHGKIISLSE